MLESDPGDKAYSGEGGHYHSFSQFLPTLKLIHFTVLFYGSFRVGKKGKRYIEVKKCSFLNEFFEESHLWGSPTREGYVSLGRPLIINLSGPACSQSVTDPLGRGRFILPDISLECGIFKRSRLSLMSTTDPQNTTPFPCHHSDSEQRQTHLLTFLGCQVPVYLSLKLHVKFPKQFSDSLPLLPGGGRVECTAQ